MFPILFETIRRDSSIIFPMLGDLVLDPPSYFTVFGRNIYFYGVFIGCGFLLGIIYCSKKSASFGIKEDDLFDLMIWLIPLSIVGARLYFVLFRLDDYIGTPFINWIAVWEGGLAIYGGVIAGMLTIIVFCRRKKISIPAMLDLIVFGLLIGQILGRWGNFMNREAFGAETDVFCRMGLVSPSGETISVHPTFLYESLWNLVCFIFLCVWVKQGRRRYDGQCILIYFFWYGIGRTWIEGLRTDSLYIGGTDIRVSQALSAVLAFIALVLLIVNARREHKPEDLFVNRQAAAACTIAGAEDKKPET